MSADHTKPVASLSLDLDNQWSYMKTHGDDGWSSFPTYLDWAVPRILEFLDERDLKITFFIVGQDAEIEKNVPALRAIGDAGHEVGNHSFNHEPWLHLYSEEELDAELAKAGAGHRGGNGASCRAAFADRVSACLRRRSKSCLDVAISTTQRSFRIC